MVSILPPMTVGLSEHDSRIRDVPAADAVPSGDH